MGRIVEITGVYTQQFEYDDAGRLIRRINHDGTYVAFEHDANGRVTSVTDELGNETQFEYDRNGNVTRIIDPLGGITLNTFNNRGLLASTTDAMGNITTFRYNLNGQLVETTDALGNSVITTFNSRGLTATVQDRRGNVTTFEYDEVGNLVRIIDAYEQVQTLSYDLLNRMVDSMNARDALWQFEYDANGRLTREISPEGNIFSYYHDANGNLVRLVDPEGFETRFYYDALNRVTRVVDALGGITEFDYDEAGRQTLTSDALNFETSAEFDFRNNITSLVDAQGRITAFEYDDVGRLVRRTNADGTYVSFEYDALGRVTRIVAENGAETLYEYDANGNVTQITNALGGVTRFEYDELNRIVLVVDALGGETRAAYDENGNLVELIAPEGNVIRFTYDRLNRIGTATDAEGNITRFAYDAEGNITRFAYDAAGNLVTQYNPDGGIIRNVFDLDNRLTRRTDGEGNVFDFFYDGNGNLVRINDGRGYNWHIEYDALGRVVAQTNPESGSFRFYYDAIGRQIRTVNEEGAETFFEYDAVGNLIRISNAYGYYRAFEFDLMNRVTLMIDEIGSVRTFEYDVMGNLIRFENAEDGIVEFEYDALGRLTREIVHESNVQFLITEFQHDALGRVVRRTDPMGHILTFTYDRNSRISTVTDERGGVTRYIYDGNGNVVEIVDALGHSSFFEYDSMNRLIRAQVYRNITIFEYNHNGLMSREINVLGNSKIMVYDGNGNLVQVTDEDGFVTEYEWTPTNLVRAINYADGRETNFFYNYAGQLVGMYDCWLGMTTVEVDLLGRMTSVTDHNDMQTQFEWSPTGNRTALIDPMGMRVEYQFDRENRMTQVTDGDDITIYEYDLVGRLRRQLMPTGEIVEHSYNVKSELVETHRIMPDGRTRRHYSFEHDDGGNLLAEVIRGEGIDRGSHESNFFRYDANNQLIEARDSWGNVTNFAYDPAGNLIRETQRESGVTTNIEFTHNAMNQLIRRSDDGVSQTFRYDRRGNLVSDGRNTYEFGADNRLARGVNIDGESVEYIYNGLGMRVQTVENIINRDIGSQNAFNSDGSFIIGPIEWWSRRFSPAEQKAWFNDLGLVRQTENPEITRDFVVDWTSAINRDIMVVTHGGHTQQDVFGLERISSTFSQSVGTYDNIETNIAENHIGTIFYHQNRMGSTSFVTARNEAGSASVNAGISVLSWTRYDAWGRILTETHRGTNFSGIDDVNDFTGHGYDQILGMFFAQFRMYDAENRRFMSVDPYWNPFNMIFGSEPETAHNRLVPDILAIRQSGNLYAYVMNSPLNFVDPLGLRVVPPARIDWDLNMQTRYVNVQNLPLSFWANLEDWSSGAAPLRGFARYSALTLTGRVIDNFDGLRWVEVWNNSQFGWVAAQHLDAAHPDTWQFRPCDNLQPRQISPDEGAESFSPIVSLTARTDNGIIFTEVVFINGQTIISFLDNSTGAEATFDANEVREFVTRQLAITPEFGLLGYLEVAAIHGARNSVDRHIRDNLPGWGHIQTGSNEYYGYIYMLAMNQLYDSQRRLLIGGLIMSVVAAGFGVVSTVKSINAINMARRQAAANPGQTQHFSRQLINSLDPPVATKAVLANKTITNVTSTGTVNLTSPVRGTAAAQADFRALNPTNFQVHQTPRGEVWVGTLPNGNTVNIHPGTTVGGAPTLEILNRATGTSIKIRY